MKYQELLTVEYSNPLLHKATVAPRHADDEAQHAKGISREALLLQVLHDLLHVGLVRRDVVLLAEARTGALTAGAGPR